MREYLACLQDEKHHLINSVHRLENIALEESFRQEAMEEVINRLLTRESFHVRDAVMETMREMIGERGHVTEDLSRLVEENEDTEDAEYRMAYDWLFSEEDVQEI